MDLIEYLRTASIKELALDFIKTIVASAVIYAIMVGMLLI